jgi:hypothetical protein
MDTGTVELRHDKESSRHAYLGNVANGKRNVNSKKTAENTEGTEWKKDLKELLFKDNFLRALRDLCGFNSL